eukprot:1179066-Prorocentrum_minimum.AAC.6
MHTRGSGSAARERRNGHVSACVVCVMAYCTNRWEASGMKWGLVQIKYIQNWGLVQRERACIGKRHRVQRALVPRCEFQVNPLEHFTTEGGHLYVVRALRVQIGQPAEERPKIGHCVQLRIRFWHLSQRADMASLFQTRIKKVRGME